MKIAKKCQNDAKFYFFRKLFSRNFVKFFFEKTVCLVAEKLIEQKNFLSHIFFAKFSHFVFPKFSHFFRETDSSKISHFLRANEMREKMWNFRRNIFCEMFGKQFALFVGNSNDKTKLCNNLTIWRRICGIYVCPLKPLRFWMPPVLKCNY